MNGEEIKTQLEKKFPELLKEKIRVESDSRIWVSALPRADFMNVFKFAINESGFNNFHMTVGLDCGETFEVLYLLSNADKAILTLRQNTPRENPVIGSINEFFSNSLFHEKELEDLFGIKVDGLPEGPRYPLPDKWPDGQYPLRKDWNPAFFNKTTMIYEPVEKAAPDDKEVKQDE